MIEAVKRYKRFPSQFILCLSLNAPKLYFATKNTLMETEKKMSACLNINPSAVVTETVFEGTCTLSRLWIEMFMNDFFFRLVVSFNSMLHNWIFSPNVPYVLADRVYRNKLRRVSSVIFILRFIGSGSFYVVCFFFLFFLCIDGGERY